jgi:hypothetical protein
VRYRPPFASAYAMILLATCQKFAPPVSQGACM